MRNTISFAERELDLLLKTSEIDNPPIIADFIPEILAIVKKFGESGQSGGSAPYIAGAISAAIKKLCLHEPICPIMGTDNEWVNVSEIGDKSIMYQNSRCSALFKDNNEVPYYVDAITWVDQKGVGFSGHVNLSDESKMWVGQNIKGFPFVPKKFYIDVISKEVKKDDWESYVYVKDESQLEEVFKYYDRKIIKPRRQRILPGNHEISHQPDLV